MRELSFAPFLAQYVLLLAFFGFLYLSLPAAFSCSLHVLYLSTAESGALIQIDYKTSICH